jgi:hypothetical protein
MNLHIARSERYTYLGSRRYRLSARLIVTAPEQEIITRHHLDRTEIFFDPDRDRLQQAAEAHHNGARAPGLFVTTIRTAAAVSLAEIRAIIAAIRAVGAFTLTLGDVLRGIAVEQPSLQAIRDLERILVASVDTIDETVQAAIGFSEPSEDVFASGDEQELTTPPAQWTRTWGTH